MNQSPVDHRTPADLPPSHDEISECARKISTDCGLPEVPDPAIWLEAERRVMASRQTPWRFR